MVELLRVHRRLLHLGVHVLLLVIVVGLGAQLERQRLRLGQLTTLLEQFLLLLSSLGHHGRLITNALLSQQRTLVD